MDSEWKNLFALQAAENQKLVAHIDAAEAKMAAKMEDLSNTMDEKLEANKNELSNTMDKKLEANSNTLVNSMDEKIGKIGADFDGKVSQAFKEANAHSELLANAALVTAKAFTMERNTDVVGTVSAIGNEIMKAIEEVRGCRQTFTALPTSSSNAALPSSTATPALSFGSIAALPTPAPASNKTTSLGTLAASAPSNTFGSSFGAPPATIPSTSYATTSTAFAAPAPSTSYATTPTAFAAPYEC